MVAYAHVVLSAYVLATSISLCRICVISYLYLWQDEDEEGLRQGLSTKADYFVHITDHDPM
jgi:hypothetical protein